MNSHCIVVGGGVVGLSVAWELSGRGHRVTLVERNRTVGSETSWAAAGILPPANLASATDPLDRLRGLSHELFPDWVSQLTAATDIDTGFRACGGLYLASTPGERASLVGMRDYWNDLDVRCETLTGSELSRREPALASHLDRSSNAWFLPDECQVRPPSLLDALHAACRKRHVTITTGTPVDDLRWSTTSAGVHATNRWQDADQVILCGGVWTGLVAEQLRLGSSLIPIRGQMLLLKSERPLLKSIVNVGHRYVLCRDDGHTLIGSCEEEVGFESGTTDSMLASLHEFAIDLVPELADAAVVKDWSGLRPLTFDGFPMIGRLPDTENVFVAAGHFRSGVHLAPATAVVVADLIDGVSPPVEWESFRVGKQQTQLTHLSAHNS